MKKTAILFAVGIIAITFFSFYRREGDGANLVYEGSGKIKLLFWRHSWQIPIGVNGPQNIRRTEPYSAALIGGGPIFTNPPFQDYYGLHYLGSISLNEKQRVVLVNMYRIMSTNGDVVNTKAFSGNGSYVVKLTRNAQPFEQAMFDQWITNGESDASTPFKDWLKKTSEEK